MSALAHGIVLFLFPDVVHKAVCHYHSLGNVVAYVVVAYHAADSGIYEHSPHRLVYPGQDHMSAFLVR